MEQSRIEFIIKICIIGIIFGLLFYFIPTQKQSLRDTSIFSIIIILLLFIILNQTRAEHFEQNLNQSHNNNVNDIVRDVVSIYSETPKKNNEFVLDEIIKKVINAYETRSQEVMSNDQTTKPLTVNIISKSNEEFIPQGSTLRSVPEDKKSNINSSSMNQNINHTSTNQNVNTVNKVNKNVNTNENNNDKDINDELPYTDYNHLPMAESYKTSDFEYGDSYLPPEKWYPTPPFPPVCVSGKRCPVCPVYTTGTPVDVKEWNSSRRITPPDNIKTSYIIDKLNSGK